LNARIDFYNIYFENFNYMEMLVPGDSWDQPWPETVPEPLKSRFFGLKPHVWLKIFNNSRHPITISHVRGYMSFGDYNGKEEIWHSCFEQGFGKMNRFPLFLQAEEERIVILPFTWPIRGTFVKRLPELTPDSLYTAPYLVNAYLSTMGRGMFGSPAGYEHELKNIFVRDLTEQIEAGPNTSGDIKLIVVLSTGEYFTTGIALP
jgi:hypothetical protein